MFRALWFLVKLGALVALTVWVSSLPGTVMLQWLDYTMVIEVGFFLMAAVVVILCAIFIYNVIRTFVDLPASYMRYRDIQNREKGYRALTLGLTAVAAGDTKIAAKQAERATKLLKNDNGLPLLLRAQAARLQGQEEDALKSFAALLENKDAAFLGVRGLLQAALDHENHSKALDLARQALKIHPNQPWILNLVYDLEIKEHKWDDALQTLRRGRQLKTLSPAQAKSDEVAILIAKSNDQSSLTKNDEAIRSLQSALSINPGFSPTALRLAEIYLETNKRGKALKVIEKAWKSDPHPDLADFWCSMIPPKKAGDAMARMKWFVRLYKLRPKSARSNLEAGHVAMKEGLLGEARAYLTKAEKLEPTNELYKMLADLERLSGQGEEAAKAWLAKAENASPNRAWICKETGRHYKDWSPVAKPHGSFNTIEWASPELSVSAAPATFENMMTEALIEAPR